VIALRWSESVQGYILYYRWRSIY